MKKNLGAKNYNLEDMPKLALYLVDSFKKPQLLLLDGALGAGKTTLVRFLLDTLEGCANDQVSSPAFAIQNTYKTSFGRVEHLDLYRLQDAEQLESTGFWDLFAEDEQDQSSLIIIEWASRLNFKYLPKNWNCIRVLCSKGQAEDNRNIQVEFLN